MSTEQRLQEIIDFGGFTSQQGATPVIEAVMTSLAELLTYESRRKLATELPEPWKSAMPLSDLYETPSSVQEFIERVAQRERVAPEFAVEHVQAVVQPLMHAIDAELRVWIMRHVGDEYGGLFEPVTRIDSLAKSSPVTHGSAEDHHTQGHRTIASSTPGSQHALNEAGNVSVKGVYVHSRSIATDSEPIEKS